MRSDGRRVRALRLDETSVPIARGTLHLRQDTLAGGLPGRMRWELYAHLEGFVHVDVGGCQVRAELDDGETLEGPAIVTNWHGHTFTLRSSGVWTGVGGW